MRAVLGFSTRSQCRLCLCINSKSIKGNRESNEVRTKTKMKTRKYRRRTLVYGCRSTIICDRGRIYRYDITNKHTYTLPLISNKPTEILREILNATIFFLFDGLLFYFTRCVCALAVVVFFSQYAAALFSSFFLLFSFYAE